MIKYYPYKSDKPNKKNYIITNDNKKVYFGAAGYSNFTIHKDEARKLRYIKDIIMKIGLNTEIIAQSFGLAGCYGIYQQ
jgi:hypothetical protein